ncbi:MAG: S9 family peptidase [Vicinamibacteria bacterium]
MNELLRAPRAKRLPVPLEKHGHVRTDPYFWLSRRDDRDVTSYLEAENAHTEKVMAATQELQETLFREITGRIEPDDSSVPYSKDGFCHYHRFEGGKEYTLHCRKKGTLEAPEEVLLDGNLLAQGHEFFSLRLSDVSPNQKLIAYGVDTRGRRFYTLYFKNLETGALLEDVVPDVTGNLAWANDNQTVFYTRQDPVTLRSKQVFRHRLGDDPQSDMLVYEETDSAFHLRVARTRTHRFLVIVSAHALTTEYRFLPADDPDAEPVVLQPRRKDHEYTARHHGEHFFILTNLEAPNFRLVKAPVAAPSLENWEEVVPHRRGVILEDLEVFRDFLVLVERRDGLRRIRILPWDGSPEHEIAFEEPAYVVELRDNHEVEAGVLRFAYSSFATPLSIYDYDMRTREKRLLKRERVIGDFDSADYASERIFAFAPDGVRIPISLVYRRGLAKNRAPLLLYGYGAYGLIHDPAFSPARLSLLDRGFVFAIAHVRGSEILGRGWYDAGRLFQKKNTFTDFIACAEHLVEAGYGDRAKLFAMGASAGGLLIGAVLNMRPDLFQGAVAQVPFVDIVTTMLDETVPLTTGEYEEWGDPRVKDYYDYILSYSPYDNVAAQDYPHLLVTAGLNDSQVQYWEPAKWVAKLRATKTGHHRLLLRTNMDAGHHGASGRFRQHRETALSYAFLLDLVDESG